MSDQFIGPEQYGQWIDECLAMAKASTSNKKADHYAQAARYLRSKGKPNWPVTQEAAGKLRIVIPQKRVEAKASKSRSAITVTRLLRNTNTKPFYSIF
jgi:hypothetical protein